MSWRIKSLPAGKYTITGLIAAAAGDAEFVVEVGDRQVVGKVAKVPAWQDFKSLALGQVEISGALADCLCEGSFPRR